MGKAGPAFLLLCSPLMVSPVFPQAAGDPSIGKVVYEKRCASCHGRKGEGLGSKTNIPNFTDAQYMATRSDEELLSKIRKGGEGTGMPAWNSILSEEDHRHVLAYIRTLPRP